MKTLVILVSLVSLLTACGGAIKGQADWRAAYVIAEDRCDARKVTSQEAYVACLEHIEENRRSTAALVPPPAPPAASATGASTASPPPAPVPQPAPPAGNSIYVPGSVGSYCSADPALTLTVDNSISNFAVEVRGSGALAPLGCDAAQKLVFADVLRRTGQVERVLVVPPHTIARYVFLPMNGGLGRPQVNYSLILVAQCVPGQACVPSTEVGRFERTYNVPRQDGHGWTQDVQSGYFTMYR